MAEQTISVGDLVCVVKPSSCDCGIDQSTGHFFIVEHIEDYEEVRCAHCRKRFPAGSKKLYHPAGSNYGWPRYRLKRIPPPEELLSKKDLEELTADA